MKQRTIRREVNRIHRRIVRLNKRCDPYYQNGSHAPDGWTLSDEEWDPFSHLSEEDRGAVESIKTEVRCRYAQITPLQQLCSHPKSNTGAFLQGQCVDCRMLVDFPHLYSLSQEATPTNPQGKQNPRGFSLFMQALALEQKNHSHSPQS